jgi:gluconate 2-dehydrogenase gamma chain
MEAPFTALTVAEVRTTRAFASRILPSGDGLPGAEEAGAVYFIDRALGGGFVKGMLPTFRKGLADLDRRARSRGAGDQGFAALPEAGQDAVLREVEKSEFFGGSRFLVVAAVFSDPSYGGNRDGAGWKVLDMAQQPMFQPPFGYYDAEEARTARGGNS